MGRRTTRGSRRHHPEVREDRERQRDVEHGRRDHQAQPRHHQQLQPVQQTPAAQTHHQQPRPGSPARYRQSASVTESARRLGVNVPNVTTPIRLRKTAVTRTPYGSRRSSATASCSAGLRRVSESARAWPEGPAGRVAPASAGWPPPANRATISPPPATTSRPAITIVHERWDTTPPLRPLPCGSRLNVTRRSRSPANHGGRNHTAAPRSAPMPSLARRFFRPACARPLLQVGRHGKRGRQPGRPMVGHADPWAESDPTPGGRTSDVEHVEGDCGSGAGRVCDGPGDGGGECGRSDGNADGRGRQPGRATAGRSQTHGGVGLIRTRSDRRTEGPDPQTADQGERQVQTNQRPDQGTPNSTQDDHEGIRRQEDRPSDPGAEKNEKPGGVEERRRPARSGRR